MDEDKAQTLRVVGPLVKENRGNVDQPELELEILTERTKTSLSGAE